jgi:hypothetical protein
MMSPREAGKSHSHPWHLLYRTHALMESFLLVEVRPLDHARFEFDASAKSTQIGARLPGEHFEARCQDSDVTKEYNTCSASTMATHESSSGFWREAASAIPHLNATEERALVHQRRVIKMANGSCDASASILTILNILSLAHASAQHPQPTRIHVFYLNPHQLLFGEHLDKQYIPHIICCLRERHEAERYRNQLTSVGDLEPLHISRSYWQEITSIGSVEGEFDTKSGMATYLDIILRCRPTCRLSMASSLSDPAFSSSMPLGFSV